MTGSGETFEELWEHLFGVAYRMVGTVAEAEDIVQESWLRWTEAKGEEEVDSPRAYLTTVVTRLAISHLRSARARREVYVGPWLPEPLATDPDASTSERVELEESITLAFMTILESLTPNQRAVFVLREAFGVSHARVADILEISEQNSRQILHRARARLRRRPRFEGSPEARRALVDGFMEAARSGDLEALASLLAEDVVAVTDGGGKAPAALKPIHGRDRVARFVIGSVDKFVPQGSVATVIEINTAPAIMATADGRPLAVIAPTFGGGRIRAVYVITNPDKLEAVREADRPGDSRPPAPRSSGDGGPRSGG